MFGYKKSLTPWSQNDIQLNFSLGKYYWYFYGPTQILCTAHNKQRTRFFLVLQHRIGLQSTWTCRFGKLGWDIYRQTIFRRFNLKSNQKKYNRVDQQIYSDSQHKCTIFANPSASVHIFSRFIFISMMKLLQLNFHSKIWIQSNGFHSNLTHHLSYYLTLKEW